MDDPLLVRRLERFRHRQGDDPGADLGERTELEVLGQGLARDQLEHEEIDLALGIEIEQRRDAGVEQSRKRARLETEAPSRRLVAQGLVADDLEGHLSLEARVLGSVHDPHPALAEALDDPVSTECCVHGVPGGTMAQHPIRKTKPPRKS